MITSPNGPAVRTDKVQVFLVDLAPPGVAGAGGTGPRLLQLHRADEPMRATWQPVMGTIEPGEDAPGAALREVREETGLDVRAAEHAALSQLDGVFPFYMASRESVYFCPVFFVEVPPAWSPTLNAEHDAWRWVSLGDGASVGPTGFVWPGQRASVRELIEVLGGPPETRAALRVDVGRP